MNEETQKLVNEITLPKDFNYPELIRSWTCFDTETTGFTKFDDVLQLSMIDMSGEAINEYFNTRPKVNHLKNGKTSITRKRTWKKSMEVHHITPKMVNDKLSLIERKDEFREIFKRYQIVVGYNVGFDVRMIASNIWYHIEYNSAIVDVLDLWREYRKKNQIATPNDKLITASKFFGWDYTAYAHNALADVYATIYVFNKLLEADEELYEKVLNMQKTPYTKKTNSNFKPKTQKIEVKVSKQEPKNIDLSSFLEDEDDEDIWPY